MSALPTPVPLQPLLEFAGFCLSHGIWTVASRGDLAPLLLIESEEGRAMVRIPGGPSASAVALARGNADSLARHLRNTGVVFDGWVRDQEDAVDVVVVEVCAPGLPEPVTVVQRYRAAEGLQRPFAILGRPLFPQLLAEAFEERAQGFVDRGIAQHPAAGKLWRTHWVADDALRKTA